MDRTSSLTRVALAHAIQSEVGLPLAESHRFVESVLQHMCDALARGENVKISGFGTFQLRDKAERIGRNPKTLEVASISPRRVVTFRASAGLKERIAPPITKRSKAVAGKAAAKRMEPALA